MHEGSIPKGDVKTNQKEINKKCAIREPKKAPTLHLNIGPYFRNQVNSLQLHLTGNIEN
jgi:hypothetical protein